MMPKMKATPSMEGTILSTTPEQLAQLIAQQMKIMNERRVDVHGSIRRCSSGTHGGSGSLPGGDQLGVSAPGKRN